MTTETITLDYPVAVDGKTVDTLTMRRSKVRDRLIASKSGGSDEDKEIGLFANLCDVAPAVIEDLDETDYAKIQQVYVGFIRGGAATSAKP